MSHHPVFDIEKWKKVFPYSSFERPDRPRHFDTTDPDDPLDRRKPVGTAVSCPSHLCCLELVRDQYRDELNQRPSVPVDQFVWSVAEPEKPYLTKLGGVPHRESKKRWPMNRDGQPCTFVAQFCFADSRDIISTKLRGDVLLMFLPGPDPAEEPVFEWSSMNLRKPMTLSQCPQPEFVVPRLSGVRLRTTEYPGSESVFDQHGHDTSYCLADSQSTKIGRTSRMIQVHDISKRWELLCTLSSLELTELWPFTDVEHRPSHWDERGEHYCWGKYRMMIWDVGCFYIMINRWGRIRCESDCH